MDVVAHFILVILLLKSAESTARNGTTGNGAIIRGIKRPSIKIIGGIDGNIYNYPWLVEVCMYSPFTGTCMLLCGGSLIDNEWVLSAAHCFSDLTARYGVKLGCENLFDTENGEVFLDVQLVRVHPDFNVSVEFSNDVALLKLEKPVKFTPRIRPICLSASESGLVSPNKAASIVGWGTTGGWEFPETFKQATVYLVPDTICATKYPKHFDQRTMICAYGSGTDACQGDSGGPLAVRHNSTQRWYLIGAVSWGYGCARPNTPGFYSRVSVQCPFIEETTGKKLCSYC